jgi:NADPH-dependent glutamate synthase beta subunit-like oxidoreductase/ferredoxin
MPESVYLLDTEFLAKGPPCQAACPVSTEAWRYVQMIADGRASEAFGIARDPNPFALVCGRICTHPCETACKRGAVDEPVAIRALKRAAADARPLVPESPAAIPPTRDRVAVVGGGPTGLTAAGDLARRGYRVTLFEASPVLGGMLALAVPRYRLPQEVLLEDVEEALSLGVEVRTNAPLDESLSLAELRRQGFRAVFLAVGTRAGRMLRVPGIDLDGVFNGVDFLINVNLGYKVAVGHKVWVIGGGNVAVDVAMTALRQASGMASGEGDSLVAEGMQAAADAARTAMRLGAREVHMVCPEGPDEMPAHRDVMEECLSEGIQLHTRLGVHRIVGEEGRVRGLEVRGVSSLFDANGRFNPVLEEGTERVFDADTVILAIGQAPDLGFLGTDVRLDLMRDGTIAVDAESLATSQPWVFAGGDVAFGPRDVIHAVADGHRAAESIHRFLEGENGVTRPREVRVRRMNFGARSLPRPDTGHRREIPMLDLERRVGISEIEQSYPAADAQREGSRCLRCNIRTVFDSDRCILCGGCVDVCPTACLRIAAVAGLALEPLGVKPRGRHAILKDESRCIQCGLCAERCPVDAITMESLEVLKEWS